MRPLQSYAMCPFKLPSQALRTSLCVDGYCRETLYEDVRGIIKDYLYQIEQAHRKEEVLKEYRKVICQKIVIATDAIVFITYVDRLHNVFLNEDIMFCGRCGNWVAARNNNSFYVTAILPPRILCQCDHFYLNEW